MQEVACQAVREYIENHSRADLLDRLLDEELPRYAQALHSVARNHGLDHGNKRLALAATLAFLMAVTGGELNDVGAIARRLFAALSPW
jgi:hypothetical protein